MNNAMNPMQGFIQGNQLASQQMQDQRAAEKQKAEMLAQNLSLIGSIALGAKGGKLDGQVDAQRFEQGLDFLASRGVNVDQFRGRPEMADVAASASLSGMQQLQAGMMANQVQQQFLQSVLRLKADERADALGQRQAAAAERAARAAEDAARNAGLPQGYRWVGEGDNRRAERIAGLPPDTGTSTPQSAIGKLNEDYRTGRITREQFDVEQERITKQSESPLPQNVITSLNVAGKTLTDADRFTRTFDPKFAGYRLNALGEAAMTAGRMGVGTEAMAQGATWWQDYARYRNQVRNELFGSALTAPEARAFEQADIQPGMAPDQIRANLTRQREAAQAAAKKLVAPHVLAGKSVEQIEAAVGFSLGDLGIERPSARQRPQPPQGASQAPAAASGATPAPAAAPAPSTGSARKAGDILGPAPEGSTEGRTGRLRDGTRVRVTNGQLVVVE